MASYNELKFDWEIFLQNARSSRNGSTVGKSKFIKLLQLCGCIVTLWEFFFFPKRLWDFWLLHNRRAEMLMSSNARMLKCHKRAEIHLYDFIVSSFSPSDMQISNISRFGCVIIDWGKCRRQSEICIYDFTAGRLGETKPRWDSGEHFKAVCVTQSNQTWS